MATPETVLSPREVLNRLYEALRNAYSRLINAKQGDVEADRQILSYIETIELLVQKLDYSFIDRLRSDANLDAGSYEKLKEIEKLLDEIMKGKKYERHKTHYLYHIAKRYRGFVRAQARKTKKTGIKKLGSIQKKEKKLKQEAEKLKKEKAEAKGRIGFKK